MSWVPRLSVALVLILAFLVLKPETLFAQALPLAKPEQSFLLDTDGEDEIRFSQPGSPNIVSAKTENGNHVDVSFNEDASEVKLRVPDADRGKQIRVLTSEESGQFSDGTIVFSALDAKVHGEQARLETHPGSHRIGFWSNEKDHVTWDFKPKRWGRYKVEVLYSQAGEAGNEICAKFESSKLKSNKSGSKATEEEPLRESLTATLESTGSWYTYRVADLGELYIDDKNFRSRIRLSVGCNKKVSRAVMNLKAVLLRPTCEGKRLIEVDEHGKLNFHSRNSTVCGVQLVYEPNPKKDTLGWWVVETDKARWNFTLDQPQAFSVEVLQGCGQGRGGSRVAVEVLQQNAPTLADFDNENWQAAKIEFEVEDTGHFQNYKRRTVGTLKLDPGSYILQVRPLSIKKIAVMDLRELTLTPVESN